jgi:ABC-type amino acid transport substrate-binding protein
MRKGRNMDCRSLITRRAGLLLFLLMMVAVNFNQAIAGGLEDARRRGKLLVGVRTDFPPLGYMDASGELQGFEVEIARYLAKALFSDDNQRLQLVPVTAESRIPFLYNGLVDVILAAMSVTEERKKMLEFTRPYFESGTVLLVRKDSPVKGAHDLSGKLTGIIQGSVQATDIIEYAPTAKVVKFSKIEDALHALRAKQIDVLCQDELVVRSILKQNPDLQVVYRPFHYRVYAAAVQKDDHEFVNWINAQIEKAKQDGTYEKLLGKYFGGL